MNAYKNNTTHCVDIIVSLFNNGIYNTFREFGTKTNKTIDSRCFDEMIEMIRLKVKLSLR